jgi:glutamate-1-semialdehyde aminotransferase
MGKGQDLYRKAKKLIPGGNQLLSKRPEMFLPDNWPAYYKKARGCEIWDLDGRHYYDMSIMGIGACVLGYANPFVSKKVKQAVDAGNSSTLNSYEEVELAEKLIKLHPWAGKVRFARTGGEACTIAVRIARAYTGKDRVMFCGYHGWHDWYLAANLADENHLDGQLLPGLDPAGVPRALSGTAVPFTYGDEGEFIRLSAKHGKELGAIIMEVERHKSVDLSFIKAVLGWAKQHRVVVIFDEVSSGFRVNVGGAHMKYGVFPDIVVLGKAMGNGHPIGAVIGKARVMDAAQKTFISSTYWTERVGFVAALATIEEFERKAVIDKITSKGGYLKGKLENLFEKHKLEVEIVGLPSVLILSIKEERPLVIKTLITQEMLKKGFLASNVMNEYLAKMDGVLRTISKAKLAGKLEELLESSVAHGGFKRLA